MIRALSILLLFFGMSRTATADNEWQWRNEQASILYYFEQKPVGFEVRLIRDADLGAGNSIRVEIYKDGVLAHKWDTHREGAFVFSGSTVVYSTHMSSATGCSLIAFDLNNRRQIWETWLKGIGLVNHSQYSNRINLRITDDKILVLGDESRGQYVETVDLQNGKTISHRIGLGENQQFKD